MLLRCGSVGVPVATSSISHGKTNLAKLAVGVCGNYLEGCLTYLTDSVARGHLSGVLPFLYDDPNDDLVLKPLLHSVVLTLVQDGLNTHLITCNEHVIESLSQADDRYALKLMHVYYMYA